MKTLISILCVCISFNSDLVASDNYKIGDSLFVWASSGLNVRNGPGTNFNIKSKLVFGSKVQIIKKTNKHFNIKGISKVNPNAYIKNTEPVIFKGNWVEIKTESGLTGFVIDQYLINLKPFNKLKIKSFVLNLDYISYDTTNIRLLEHEGGLKEYKTKTVYNKNIVATSTFGGYTGEVVFTFKNYSIEEVLIIFSSAFNNYEEYVVDKNWENEIDFSDYEMCYFTVRKEGSTVIFSYGCSC
jgi:hypothetical protein